MEEMKRVDITKAGDQWVAKSGGKVVAKADKKVDAVRETAREARKMAEDVTVKIHKENGRIQEERTYPRAADPRKSRG